MYNLQSIGRMFPHVMLPIPRTGFGSSFTLACVSQCSPLFLHSETGFGFGLDLANWACQGWTPLSVASGEGHAEVGQIFMETAPVKSHIFFPDFSYLFISSFDIIDICWYHLIVKSICIELSLRTKKLHSPRPSHSIPRPFQTFNEAEEANQMKSTREMKVTKEFVQNYDRWLRKGIGSRLSVKLRAAEL